MTNFPFPYVITVSDGVKMRSVHPSALNDAQREAVEQVLREVVLVDKPATATAPAIVATTLAKPSPPPVVAKATASMVSTMTQGEAARASGFTGNACSKCGSFEMVRTGTCETCQLCGETSGGCS